MIPHDIARLRDSLGTLADKGTAIVHCFYTHLFALDPMLRPLFAVDMEAQRAKFADMLTALVAVLDRPDERDALYAEIGRRHLGYGVREADYDTVGAALLRCLREVAGAHWDDAAEQAWASFYGELAEAMIAAARVRAPPQSA